jgi:hypothetical protein
MFDAKIYLWHLQAFLIRERPFNLKGGIMVFFLKKIFWCPMLLKKNILILVEEKKIWFRVFVI